MGRKVESGVTGIVYRANVDIPRHPDAQSRVLEILDQLKQEREREEANLTTDSAPNSDDNLNDEV